MLTIGSEHVSFRSPAGATLWQAQLLVEDEEGQHTATLAADGHATAGPWQVRLETLPGAAGLDVLSLTVAPVPGRRLDRVLLAVAGNTDAVAPLDCADTRMLALQSGLAHPEGVIRLGGEPVSSALATVLVAPARPALLFGLGGISEDFTTLHVENGTLTAGFRVERELRRPETYALAFGAAEDPLALLERYGDHLAQWARPAGPVPTGWNSWDYYGGAIALADVRREMAAINASPLRGKLKYLTLDMGWEQAWGEWVPNGRFPQTYRALAEEIEAAGFVPGVWLAPLQAHTYSRLGRHRQDLLVPGADGYPVTVGQHALLDFTLPEVHDILREWFGGLRAAGFRLFKLDYIYADYLAVMNHCADRTRGKAGIIRQGLEVIREAVGPESHILNCGAPVECALGLADSARVTTDIHTFWGHVKHNARQLSARLWQNGRLWRIDPDFAIIRCADTSGDPFPNPIYQRRPLVAGQGHWMAGPEASYPELCAWLTQVTLSGGNLFLSDSIARLNDTGITTLAKLFPPRSRAARPLDLFQSEIPRFWLSQGETGAYLGVFNWEDEAAPIVVPPGLDVPPEGVDLWSGQPVTVAESTLMPPRSAYLLRVA